MIKIQKQFEMQKVLDDRIYEKFNLNPKNTMNKRVVAFIVELGEMANETRCFKFWTQKPPSAREVILEEFVDGWHFILSCGITNGSSEDEIIMRSFEPRYLELDMFKETDVVQQIIEIIDHIWIKLNDPDAWMVLAKQYLAMGEMLGFTIHEINEAYDAKNVKNHNRQTNGY